jgi:hypothetical protein
MPFHPVKPAISPGTVHHLAFPIDFFDVPVHFNSQAVAPSSPPILQDLASIGGSHASAKSMYAHPASNFWLVCPFDHN